MPVTFHPSTQPLTAVAPHSAVYNAAGLFRGAGRPDLVHDCRPLLQSSFGSLGNTTRDFEDPIVPSSNGFVNGAIEAYTQHHHLIIRPDEVWITILTQLSLYVNANAEDLRKRFVIHSGKRTLTVVAAADRFTADMPSMVEQMALEIQKNVIDHDLRTWILPDFTTTTPSDRIVSSVVLMATLKKYFDYQFSFVCGLPAVTLLGEKKDWIKMATKMEKLPSYGAQAEQWYKLLKPVLSRFITAFDHPNSKENRDFWQQIADKKFVLMGCTAENHVTGWITSFMFFDKSGRSLSRNQGGVTLDGVRFHTVDVDSIPPAYAEVDVALDDNGQRIDSRMVAGVVGYKVMASGNTTTHPGVKRAAIQPVSGWWLFEKKEAKSHDDGSRRRRRHA